MLQDIKGDARLCGRKFLVLYDLKVKVFFLATWVKWRRILTVNPPNGDEDVDLGEVEVLV